MNPNSGNLFHGRSGGIIAPFVMLLLAWGAVVRMLWNDWRVDPQYSYGVLVPLLVLGLCIKRFEDAPAAPSVPLPPRARGAAVLLFASTLALSFLIPIAEANPDWRLLGWAAALCAVTLTLCLLYLAGGRAWLSHYAFPACFFLIAVPWPRNLEQTVMNALTSWNAGTTLEILHWCGFEAARRGNLIMIPAGILGIEEACSGIRSLQSGLMVALFFGEVFRLTALRRGLLLVTAVVVALLGNIFRSSLLAVVASRQGLAAVSSWHDPAGMIVLLLTFGSVFAVAALWRCAPSRTVLPVHSGRFDAVRVSRVAAVSGAILFTALFGTECWFRLHEGGSAVGRSWALHPREGIPGVSRVEVPQATLKMMYYPEGFSERWIRGDRHEGGQSFYFRWAPGRTSLQAVSMHNPEVCLGSIGMKMKAPLSSYTYESSGLSIPFRSWLFEQNGRPVHVFQAMVSDGDLHHAGLDFPYDSLWGRFRVVLEGRRNRGQRMVEVAFWNLPDESTAREALGEYLNQALTADPVADRMNPTAP